VRTRPLSPGAWSLQVDGALDYEPYIRIVQAAFFRVEFSNFRICEFANLSDPEAQNCNVGFSDLKSSPQSSPPFRCATRDYHVCLTTAPRLRDLRLGAYCIYTRCEHCIIVAYGPNLGTLPWICFHLTFSFIRLLVGPTARIPSTMLTSGNSDSLEHCGVFLCHKAGKGSTAQILSSSPLLVLVVEGVLTASNVIGTMPSFYCYISVF
jgi:hypothetical protein